MIRSGRIVGSLVLLVALGIGAFKAGIIGHPWNTFEWTTLNPGFRSAATPGDLGLSFQHVNMQSGPRKLDAFFVPASSECVRPAAVLIFHGRGETIAEWGKAQQHFHDACIASLAFDYSGHGRSDGAGTIENLNADAVTAYQKFIKLTPNQRHCLFSHSMGGGPMLWAATAKGTSVDCIVIASPFSSLTSMAEHGGLPKLLGALMPELGITSVECARYMHRYFGFIAMQTKPYRYSKDKRSTMQRQNRSMRSRSMAMATMLFTRSFQARSGDQ